MWPGSGLIGEYAVVSDPSILVVDDDEQICDLIRDGLSSCGLKCETRTDAINGMDIVEHRPLALLIADFAMPVFNGLDFLIHARYAQPACRVVLMTGTARRDVLARAVKLGAYDCLEKPFDIQKLLDTAHRALETYPGPVSRL